MKKLSKVEAAYIILKESNKKEMSCKEIIDIAINRGMIETKGKTPEQTLRVDINNENARHRKSKRPERFIMKSKGIVSLK